MPCTTVKFPDGTIAIVEHACERRRQCKFCREWSTQLCDHITGQDLFGRARTCDAPLCRAHATRIGDLDLCPDHANEGKALAL